MPNLSDRNHIFGGNMAKTLRHAKQQAINALKDKLTAMDAVKHPSKFAKLSATLRRMEKDLERNSEHLQEPEMNASQVEYQINQLLEQIKITHVREEQYHLFYQIAELAGWGEQFPKGDPEAEKLFNKIIIAIEKGRKAKAA
jgi:hypothetical protein